MFKTGARLQYDKNHYCLIALNIEIMLIYRTHIKTLGFMSAFWGKGFILALSSQTNMSVHEVSLEQIMQKLPS